MPYHVENKSSEILLKTIMLLLAVGLNGIEILLPRIPMLPWLKPGFSNIITIIWIIRFGLTDSLLFTFLRSWISGFYFGFSLLTLTLSISGGLFSTCLMSISWHYFGKKGTLGTIGLGMLGAVSHNSGQLFAVYFLLIRNISIFYQIPFMIVASIIFGGITGFFVPTISDVISPPLNQLQENSLNNYKYSSYSKNDALFSILIVSTCIIVFIIPSIPILCSFTLLITITAYLITEHKQKVFYYPLRFKYLFLFIILTYVLFSPGKRILALPFLTDEGIRNATLQIIRIWYWIEAGLLLHVFHFNDMLFFILKRIFPRHQNTLSSGILALEHFPEIISTKKMKINWTPIIKNPTQYLKKYVNDLYKKMDVITTGN